MGLGYWSLCWIRDTSHKSQYDRSYEPSYDAGYDRSPEIMPLAVITPSTPGKCRPKPRAVILAQGPDTEPDHEPAKY